LAIVYAAVGRRLGYPVKLATSRSPKWGHVFCRWEDANGEVFNFEANWTGVGFMSDDHYREKGLTPEVEKGGLFLKSLTPRQELAMFLSERATQAYECGRLFECVDAWAYAWSLSPENVIYLNTLEDRYKKWQEDLNRRTPPGFPKGWFKVTQRRYPDALPLVWEQKIICHQAVANLLNDPAADGRWWAPLRQRDRWARTPRGHVGRFPTRGPRRCASVTAPKLRFLTPKETTDVGHHHPPLAAGRPDPVQGRRRELVP
jgi:hypothetical protein